MKRGQVFGLYAGVFVLSMATVALSVVLTRLYSAVLGHHFAFFAISLALFGAGAGGLVVTLFPALVRPPLLFSRLASVAGLAALTAIGAGIYLARFKPADTLDLPALGHIGVLYAVTAVPFALSGVVIAGSIAHAGNLVGRLYFADMLGAALGGAVAIVALRFGAPRAVLGASIGLGLASVIFMLAGRASPGAVSGNEQRPHPGIALAFFLSTLTSLAGDIGAPWFKLDNLRYVSLSKVQFEKWNELALVTVDRPVKGMAWMRMDGSAATAILDDKTQPPKHPDQMGYALSGASGPSVVLGAGGGRDVRAALAAGQTDVYAVEINPVIVDDVMLGEMKEFSKSLYARPEVHVVVADGRSFVRSSDLRFRNMTLSLVDTWAAASVGGLALSENGLYTVEAFRDFIGHLSDDGSLVVNRWDGELDRLLVLATTSLRMSGVADPRAHLFSCSFDRSTALLVKKTPLTPLEIQLLEAFCKKNRFEQVLSPAERPSSPLRAAILDGTATRDQLTAVTDLTPPTDDRPFFFYTVPPDQIVATVKDTRKLAADQQGLATLSLVFGASVVLAVLGLLVPLAVFQLRKRKSVGVAAAPLGTRLRIALFFSAIGLGFVLVEVAMVQHLTMFLGHPVYALSAVLVILLSSSGVGSLLSGRVALDDADLVAARRAKLAAILLVVLGVALPIVLGKLVGLPIVARLVVVAVVLFPLGLLLGAQAPLGARIAARRSRDLVAWGWALNGFMSVVGASFGMILAMNVGFSFLLLVGAAAYLLAAIALPPATRLDESRAHESVGAL